MHAKPWAFGEPRADARCFVRAVVVHDDVDLLIGWHADSDAVQEFAELERAMTVIRLAKHTAALDVERGKQRDGAMFEISERLADAIRVRCKRSNSNGSVC